MLLVLIDFILNQANSNGGSFGKKFMHPYPNLTILHKKKGLAIIQWLPTIQPV